MPSNDNGCTLNQINCTMHKSNSRWSEAKHEHWRILHLNIWPKVYVPLTTFPNFMFQFPIIHFHSFMHDYLNVWVKNVTLSYFPHILFSPMGIMCMHDLGLQTVPSASWYLVLLFYMDCVSVWTYCVGRERETTTSKWLILKTFDCFCSFCSVYLELSLIAKPTIPPQLPPIKCLSLSYKTYSIWHFFKFCVKLMHEQKFVN